MNESNIVEYNSIKYYRRTINGYYVLCPIINGSVDYENYVYEHRFLYEMYHGVKLPSNIHVHHVNHDRSDNRPDNLVAMTSTEHATKHHVENGYHIGPYYCVDCGKRISRKASRCTECYRKQHRSRIRPTKEELSKLIQTMSNCAIGRLYGVSDTAVRKWRALYGLPKVSAQCAS